MRLATVVSAEEASDVFRLRHWREVFRRSRLGRESHIWQLFHGRPDLGAILEAAAGDAADDTAVGMSGPGGRPWSLHLVDGSWTIW